MAGTATWGFVARAVRTEVQGMQTPMSSQLPPSCLFDGLQHSMTSGRPDLDALLLRGPSLDTASALTDGIPRQVWMDRSISFFCPSQALCHLARLPATYYSGSEKWASRRLQHCFYISFFFFFFSSSTSDRCRVLSISALPTLYGVAASQFALLNNKRWWPKMARWEAEVLR